MNLRTQRPLEADNSLALALLAAVAHPDPDLRRRVAARLDAEIAAAEPLHDPEEVRRFLLHQSGTPLEPFSLDAPALELAVLLVRLTFSRRESMPALGLRCVRLVGSRTQGDGGGLLVRVRRRPRRSSWQLEGWYLERLAYGKRRGRASAFDPFHLVAAALTPRLRELEARRRQVRATCRARQGYHLTVSGDLPWARFPVRADLARALQYHSVLSSGKSLNTAGLTVESSGNDLIIHTTTPESIIQFSASLARGEVLSLRCGWVPARLPASPGSTGQPGRMIVALRDFEGGSAEFAAVAGYGEREDWLCAPALPHLAPGVEDRLAIARWLYLPDAWAEEALLRSLLVPAGASGIR
jgi:hypothetical protein